MGEIPEGLFSAIKGAPWPSWLATVGLLLWIILRQLREFKISDANNEAKVGAIAIYQEMSKELREALDEMTKRADEFAKERNEMAVNMARMEGKLAEMTRSTDEANARFAQIIDLVQSQNSQVSELVSLIKREHGGGNDKP